MRSASLRIDWLLFVLLGFLWGSSYLFIKIGVEAGLQPFTLVMLRLLIGFLLLAALVAVARERLPRRLPTYGHLVVVALLGVLLPFTLITWAEQSVDSTLAAVITGAIPLFAIIIAATALPDEAFSGPRVAGVIVGLVGLIVLVGLDPGVLAGTSLLPALALIGSTASYAAGGVYARRFLSGLRAMVIAVVEIGLALAMAIVLAVAFERPIVLPASADALLAIGWLGLLGSGLAFLVYFRLLAQWGATRTSLVAYLIPIFGLVLGAAVLAEPIDVRLVFGTGLIVGGISLFSLQPTPDADAPAAANG